MLRNEAAFADSQIHSYFSLTFGAPSWGLQPFGHVCTAQRTRKSKRKDRKDSSHIVLGTDMIGKPTHLFGRPSLPWDLTFMDFLYTEFRFMVS